MPQPGAATVQGFPAKRRTAVATAHAGAGSGEYDGPVFVAVVAERGGEGRMQGCLVFGVAAQLTPGRHGSLACERRSCAARGCWIWPAVTTALE
jgi:hypothetical protein